jgi:hypothetical protein
MPNGERGAIEPNGITARRAAATKNRRPPEKFKNAPRADSRQLLHNAPRTQLAYFPTSTNVSTC